MLRQTEDAHDADDRFTLYASPRTDSYQVFVYPAVPGAGLNFEVSAAQFKDFQLQRQSRVEENQLPGSADVLMCLLSEEDVRELARLAPTPRRLDELPYRAA